MDDKLKKQLEYKGLVINRLPSWAKALFKEWAKEEFSDDYGMLLASLIKETQEYRRLKEMFFSNQLDIKLLLNNKSENTEKAESEPKSISGKPIKSFKGRK